MYLSVSINSVSIFYNAKHYSDMFVTSVRAPRRAPRSTASASSPTTSPGRWIIQ